MTPQIFYYSFSLATVLLILYYLWNAFYYRHFNRTLFGLTFKKGTVEYERMRKSTTSSYLWLASGAFALSIVNLVFAISDVFRTHTRNAAIVGVVTYTLVIVIGLMVTFSIARSMFGEKQNKR